MIRDLEASEADEIERERELEGTQLGEPRRKLNCRVDLDWIGLDWDWDSWMDMVWGGWVPGRSGAWRGPGGAGRGRARGGSGGGGS